MRRTALSLCLLELKTTDDPVGVQLQQPAQLRAIYNAMRLDWDFAHRIEQIGMAIVRRLNRLAHRGRGRAEYGIPHGTINRMLMAGHITDRILGVSKTATVNTRTLFLGSGNNVGPIRDLLRRVLTIHIDPRCATPATFSYKGFPVDKVR